MTPEATKLKAVLDYVDRRGAITNRESRELLGLSYDNAIKLLGGLSSAGVLQRTGTSSSTKYVRSSNKVSRDKLQSALLAIEKLLKSSHQRRSA